MGEDALRLPPEEIEGIGPVRGAALREAGIETLADLVERGPHACRAALEDVSLAQARGWVAAARLMQLDAVDGDLAESFVLAGLDSIEALADAGEEGLGAALEAGREARRLRELPGARTLRSIVREAGRMADAALVLGRVVEREDGRPVSGVEVRLGRRRATTDAAGRFVFEGAPTGPQELIVQRPGRHPLRVPVDPRGGEAMASVRVRLAPAPARPVAPRRVDESKSGVTWLSRAARARLVEGTLAELPAGALLVVRGEDSAGRVKLLHLQRQRVGDELRTTRVRMRPEELPDGARSGVVLRWDGSGFELTELSQRDVARQRLEAVVGPRTWRVVRRRREIEIF